MLPENHKSSRIELKKPAALSLEELKDATKDALDALAAQIQHDGRFEGEVEWSALLSAQYVLAHWIVGDAIQEKRRENLLRYFDSQRRKDHGYSLSAGTPSTLFVSTLVYCARRLLAQPKEELIRDLDFIHDCGGSIKVPTWGKFWLAMLGLYRWEGMHPLSPEVWLMPEKFPLHPSRFYCHTRLIHASMSMIYGLKPRARASSIIDELKSDLFIEDFDQIDFSSTANELPSAEVLSPPTKTLKAFLSLLRQYENYHRPFLRKKALFKLANLLDSELRATHYSCISPVSGLLTWIALYLHENDIMKQQKIKAGIERWSWEDAKGYRLAGARSDVWDSAFSIAALTESGHAPDYKRTIDSALDYLQKQQANTKRLVDSYRISPGGGFGFTAIWQNWPVSDCTAEALIALILSNARISSNQLKNGLQFILRCQNKDGGFGSYESARTRFPLHHFEASELFADAMSERSYVECTASCLELFQLIKTRKTIFFTDKIKRAAKKALRWLVDQQHVDGSFYGSWGVCFLYGSYFALRGLAHASDKKVQRARDKTISFLLSAEHQDGGWGEAIESCMQHRYLKDDKICPVQTSWAMLGLMTVPNRTPDLREALNRGAKQLIEMQKKGPYPSYPRGVFFQSGLLNYRHYAHVFPAWALSRYQRWLTQS